jgi:hypothetical protein
LLKRIRGEYVIAAVRNFISYIVLELGESTNNNNNNNNNKGILKTMKEFKRIQALFKLFCNLPMLKMNLRLIKIHSYHFLFKDKLIAISQ